MYDLKDVRRFRFLNVITKLLEHCFLRTHRTTLQNPILKHAHDVYTRRFGKMHILRFENDKTAVCARKAIFRQ